MSKNDEKPEKKKAETPAEKLQAYLDSQTEKLKINEVELNDDFINQAPSYLRAALNFHKAERQLQIEKHALEAIVAAKDAELRASGEKTTESFIDKAIKGDDEYKAQKQRIIDAEFQVGCHQAVMRSWDHKRDMLIQVGAVQRAEMSGQVQINKTSPEQERPKTKNGRPTEL